MADTIQNNLDTKCGLIAQNCGEEKAKGCEHCNQCHPSYDRKEGVRFYAGKYYSRLDFIASYSEETGAIWECSETEVFFCPKCGRNLYLPVDLTAWGIDDSLAGV